jgi:hypothetical protein
LDTNNDNAVKHTIQFFITNVLVQAIRPVTKTAEEHKETSQTTNDNTQKTHNKKSHVKNNTIHNIMTVARKIKMTMLI